MWLRRLQVGSPSRPKGNGKRSAVIVARNAAGSLQDQLLKSPFEEILDLLWLSQPP